MADHGLLYSMTISNQYEGGAKQPRTHSKTSSVARIAAAVAAARAKDKKPSNGKGKRKTTSSGSCGYGVAAKRKKIGSDGAELAEWGDADADDSGSSSGPAHGRNTRGGGPAAASIPPGDGDNDAFQALWLRQTCFENEMRQRHVALQASIGELRNYCGRQFEILSCALRSLGGIVDGFGPPATEGQEDSIPAPTAKDGDDEANSKRDGDDEDGVLDDRSLPDDREIGLQIEGPPSAIKMEGDGERPDVRDSPQSNERECTPVVVVVCKPEPNSRLGIGLVDFGFEQEGMAMKKVKVSNIDSDGLFRQTALTVGMTISAINGEKCVNAEEAASLLKESEGQITVVALKEEASKPAELSRGPRTLDLLWKEYKIGLDGNKPAEKFTKKERNSGTWKQMYYRRNVIWKCIQRLVGAGLTAEVAIWQIHKVYGHNTSSTEIITRMVADKAEYKEHDGMHPDLQPSKAALILQGAEEGGAFRPAALSHHPSTLELLWTEYKMGLDGNKPAEQFTTYERNSCSKTKQRYYRRNVLWQCIERLVIEGLSPQAAIALIHRVYGVGKSPSELIKSMVEDKRKYAGGINPLLLTMASRAPGP